MLQLEENAIKKANTHLEKREVQQDKFVKAYGHVANDMQELAHNLTLSVSALNSMTQNIQANEDSMNSMSLSLIF